jgi:hypothetical protein
VEVRGIPPFIRLKFFFVFSKKSLKNQADFEKKVVELMAALQKPPSQKSQNMIK